MESKELAIEATLYVGNEAIARALGECLCERLKGNQDFIDNKVIINYTDDPGRVHIYVYEGAEPETILQLIGG